MSPTDSSTLPGGGLVISLDFELFWGMRDKLPLDRYRAHILGAREAIPRLLALFSEHEVHATWATVGAILCADPDDLRGVLPARQPRYADPRLSVPDLLQTLGGRGEDGACFFAPELVQEIRRTPHQEVATHTLTHLPCLEPGPDADDLRADLAAALDLHEARLGERPRSIVFPRNQVAWLEVCAELGLNVVRSAAPAPLHTPRSSDQERLTHRALRLADAYLPLIADTTWALDEVDVRGEVLCIPASRFLRPRLGSLARLDNLRIRRVEQELTRAARTGRLFHLWWHPHNLGVDMAHGLAMVRRILEHHRRLRERHGTASLTMSEVAALVAGAQASPAA